MSGLSGRALSADSRDLKGNNDLLALTQPDIICEIHRSYLEAGADLIETNTFNANRISLADYGMEDHWPRDQLHAARACRARRPTRHAAAPSKPRFVAGALGPTNRTASRSPRTSTILACATSPLTQLVERL